MDVLKNSIKQRVIGELEKQLNKGGLQSLKNPSRQMSAANLLKPNDKGAKQSSMALTFLRQRKQSNQSHANIRDYFSEHFDIDTMISFKCIAAKCVKIKNQKFLLKQLPQLDLDGDIIQKWRDTPPILPEQGFAQCYGTIKIDEKTYIISDLIEDNVPLPHQKALFVKYNQKSKSREEADKYFENNTFLSDNMYTLIENTELGNLSILKEIPSFYIRNLFNYILKVSKTFSYCHENGLVHGNFGMTKVLAQQIEHKNGKSEFNYFVTNFEPWRANLLLKNFQVSDDDYQYLMEKYGLTYKDALDVIKILDLQAFGNSILEFMVGKCQEKNNSPDVPTSKVNSFVMDLKPDSTFDHTGSFDKAQTLIQHFTGGISLDSIPLTWCKHHETAKILQIVNMCFGPYDINNSTKHVNTSKIFQEIHELALSQYEFLYGEFKFSSFPDQQIKIPAGISLNYQDKVFSSLLNNQGVTTYFNVNDDISQELKDQIVLQSREKFMQALRVYPRNIVAKINWMFLEFNAGAISDEALQRMIQTEIYDLNPKVAFLLYILFKKNVQNFRVSSDEHDQMHDGLNKQNSNLCNQILLAEDFAEGQMKKSGADSKNLQINKSFKEINMDSLPRYNLTVKIDGSDFKPEKGIFFSNNDYYIGVMSNGEFITIDSRSGKKVFAITLPTQKALKNPKFRKMIMQQSGDLIASQQLLEVTSSLDAGSGSISPQEVNSRKVILTVPISQRDKIMPSTVTSGTRETNSQSGVQASLHVVQNSLDQMKSLFNLNSTSMDSQQKLQSNDSAVVIQGDQQTNRIKIQEGYDNDELSSDHSESLNSSSSLREISEQMELTNLGQYTDNARGLRYEKSQSIIDNDILMDKISTEHLYPCIWEASIRNNGKMVAVYDRNQLVRNSKYTFRSNEKEEMYIYSITISKTSQFEPNIYRLDMRRLLKNEEVLNFGFDDFNNEKFSIICVQAKDLYLYMIDFIKHQVVKKIDQRHPVVWKSIFLKPQSHEHNFDRVKQIIQEEERLGNKVLLPKMSNRFIAVQIQDTNRIKIYSIRHRRFIRQLSIYPQDVKFDPNSYKNNLVEKFQTNLFGHLKKTAINDIKKQSLLSNQLDLSQLTPAKSFESIMQRKHDKSDLDVSMLSNTQRFTAQIQQFKIQQLEISSTGRLFVAQINNEIIIRVVKIIYSRFDAVNDKMDYNRSFSFLPVYFDNDYLLEKEKLQNHQSQHFCIDNMFHETPSNLQQAQVKFPKQLVVDDLSASQSSKSSSIVSKSHDIAESIEKDETFTPGYVDRICITFHSLLRMVGMTITQSKADKIFECYNFIKKVQANPKCLMDCRLRKKNRSQKLQQCISLIRQYIHFERNKIHLQKCMGLNTLLYFDSLQYERSFHYIKSFTGTSDRSKTYFAALIDRKLHVYNFMTKQMLFEVNVPSANQQMPPVFLDHDNILAVQEGRNCISFVNVQSQIEAFGRAQVKQSNQDITIKIEKPQGYEIDIDTDFVKKGAESDSQERKSEESEQAVDSLPSKQFLEHFEDIEQVFFNQNTSQLSYVIITSGSRFTIYYVGDDSFGNVETSVHWDNDYRFDKELKSLGKITAVEMEKQGTILITGTQLGWICIWNSLEKKLIKKFRNVYNGVTEQINKIFCPYDQTQIYCYNSRSMNLILSYTHVVQVHGFVPKDLSPLNTSGNGENTVDSMQSSIRRKMFINLNTFEKLKNSDQQGNKQMKHFNVLEQLDMQEKKKLGHVEQIKATEQLNHLVLFFKSGYLQVYDIYNPEQITLQTVLGPYESRNVFIDDYCTYLALLDKNEKQIQVSIFDWQYRVDIDSLITTSPVQTTRKTNRSERFSITPRKVTAEEVSKSTLKDVAMLGSNQFNILKKSTEDLEVHSSEQQQSKACSIF